MKRTFPTAAEKIFRIKIIPGESKKQNKGDK